MSNNLYWGQIYFQESVNEMSHNLKLFHDYSMMLTIGVLIFSCYSCFFLNYNKYISFKIINGHLIETIWTILPGVILIMIAIPSLKLLYLLEEIMNPFLTIKVIGHQWFWTYEYNDFTSLNFNSYCVPDWDLVYGEKRNAECDLRLIIPLKETIRFLITSSDVIHSWSIPSMGIKMDAIPGRLNQIQTISTRTGNFIGQCSEICGSNHSFMPIHLEVLTMKDFMKWI